MLSILIPVYKQRVTPFVTDLYRASVKANIEFEIIVMDDGFEQEFRLNNEDILVNERIKIFYLDKNIGRSAIRNKLFEKASFPNLLYLDADGELESDDFVIHYKQFLDTQEIVSGGRIYQPEIPKDPNIILHWKYGLNKESKSALVRNKSTYLSFHSNNFLVPKSIMQAFPFDETIKTYGYEDLLWAKTLFKEGIQIRHIDNPVKHLGLDDSDNYLEKIEDSMANLVMLSNTPQALHLPLESAYNNLQKLGLSNVFVKIFDYLKLKMISNLKSNSPSLGLLQWYKLGRYAELKLKK
ncbi:MAG: glycosyltransferase [Saprospiraceae bacterium]